MVMNTADEEKEYRKNLAGQLCLHSCALFAIGMCVPIFMRTWCHGNKRKKTNNLVYGLLGLFFQQRLVSAM